MVDEKGKQQSNPGGMTVDGKLAKKQHINGTKKNEQTTNSKKMYRPAGAFGERGSHGFHLLPYCRSYGTGKKPNPVAMTA
jgi:hypothetical protein